MNPEPWHVCNIGPEQLEGGFGAHYTIDTIRNLQNGTGIYLLFLVEPGATGLHRRLGAASTGFLSESRISACCQSGSMNTAVAPATRQVCARDEDYAPSDPAANMLPLPPKVLPPDNKNSRSVLTLLYLSCVYFLATQLLQRRCWRM